MLYYIIRFLYERYKKIDDSERSLKEYIAQLRLKKTMENQIELNPINIAVVAPTGAGKTALISTVIEYIDNKQDFAEGYEIEFANQASEVLLKEFNNELDGKLAAQNMEFDSKLIKSTSTCQEYDFNIIFRGQDTAYIQPFKILDIPGGYVNNSGNYQKEEIDKFRKHLDSSCILWIPIDAPILMETSTQQEKGSSAVLRCVTNLKKYVKEWSQNAKKAGKPVFANFVLVKSEKYFSKDIKGEYKQCKIQFDEAYGHSPDPETPSVVDIIKQNCGELASISCIGVETIGSIQMKKSQWKDGAINVRYSVTDTVRKIEGAQYLIKDALKLAISNVKIEIDKIRQEAELKEEAGEKMVDKASQILNDGNIFSVFFNWITGELEKAKNRMEQGVRTVEESKNEIAGLEQLIVFLTNLYPKDESSKYYRPL